MELIIWGKSNAQDKTSKLSCANTCTCTTKCIGMVFQYFEGSFIRHDSFPIRCTKVNWGDEEREGVIRQDSFPILCTEGDYVGEEKGCFVRFIHIFESACFNSKFISL